MTDVVLEGVLDVDIFDVEEARYGVSRALSCIDSGEPISHQYEFLVWLDVESTNEFAIGAFSLLSEEVPIGLRSWQSFLAAWHRVGEHLRPTGALLSAESSPAEMDDEIYAAALAKFDLSMGADDATV